MGTESSNKDGFFKRLLSGLKPNSKNELAEVIKEARESDIINEDTEDMIKGVFDVSRLRISDIMIPRSKMTTIDKEATLKEAINIIATSGHSRYPVISRDKDHIEGILLAKDLLPFVLTHELESKIDESLFREAVIVPESKRVDTMLKDFRTKRNHLAVTVDEFGGVCGLVTIEDILELIVGDIGDEYDVKEEKTNSIVKSENGFLVSGSTEIEAFNEFFKVNLPKVDVDTIAGLVIHSIGHIPNNNEIVPIDKFTFKVLDASDMQVRKLLVTISENTENS